MAMTNDKSSNIESVSLESESFESRTTNVAVTISQTQSRLTVLIGQECQQRIVDKCEIVMIVMCYENLSGV